MVDFEWYRSFIAVYRSGTVTGAAKVRFLTQPAISQHIAALESSVGQALFQRTPRKMLPSEQGKALYSRIAPAMDSLEKVSGDLRDVAVTECPLIRLGTPLDYFHETGLERLKGAPFRLQIEMGDTSRMLNALSRGNLDAVVATQQLDVANVDYTKIDQEEFCLVASPEIKLPAASKKSRQGINDIEQFLLQQTWISYSVELPIIRRFWRIVFKRRPNIEPMMIAPSLLLIRKAVEMGEGISVLPRYLCQQALDDGRLHILWEPQELMMNELWLATQKVDRNRSEIEQLLLLMQMTKT